MSVLVGEAGLIHLKPATDTPARESLVFKGFGHSRPLMRRGPTLVIRGALSDMLGERLEAAPAPPQRPPRAPTAHEQRRARDKAERHQRRRATFMDSIAFAYFREWRLDTAIDITWERCVHADPAHGHILGLPDRRRCARLRDEFWRACHREGMPFACTWSRADGGGYGPHLHLGVWSAGHPEGWTDLLVRLTGIKPAKKRLGRGHVAKGDGGGWLIKRNTDPFALKGALRWGAYQLKQERHHPRTADLDGKLLDVSRDISTNAIAPFRQEFEAWKRDVGFDRLMREALECIA